MPAWMAVARPVADYTVCSRCGIVAPSSTRAPTGWRCGDCKGLECGNGHLWPDEPARDGKGHRRCLLCENERRRRKTAKLREKAAAA